ncbi:hypothetical protein HHI36_009853 [Cryptolaemus montrouzieri]|uniref:Uncharacterized protein n=1 Tax=Cryptolaemus montrouzieri TaxID=559131 RepID=A0ABD2MGY6_9CUCU
MKPNKQEDLIEWSELNKLIRKNVGKDIRKYYTRIIRETIENNRGPEIFKRKTSKGKDELRSSADVTDSSNNNAPSNQHPENNQSIDLNIAPKDVISVSDKQSELAYLNTPDGNCSGGFDSEDDVPVAQLQQNKLNFKI